MKKKSPVLPKKVLTAARKKTKSKTPVKRKITPEPKVKKAKITKAIVSKKNSIKNPFPVVAIGASAGGLEAVTKLFQNLSPTTGMAYIYVQHLSPDHKSILTSLLSKVTKMKVQDIEDMDKIKPDNVYIIPYNKVIEVTDGHIKIIPRLKTRAAVFSIDKLFTSLAETHTENVIGIILSGSANDGSLGLKDIKLAGGITFAQDDSAKFISMPHSAIAEGVVDFILSPKEIALKLNWMSKHPIITKNELNSANGNEIESSNPFLKKIFQQLYKSKNVDFSQYKMNTLKRRILRRMLIQKVQSLKQYADLIEKDKTEIDFLHQDLLINVTDFFRDPEAFLLLTKTVLPNLLKNKSPEETLRIWVAACATGEEVYSLAMLLNELQANKSKKIPFQIFASDLSDNAISKARMGEYSTQQLRNVSTKRLNQFFVKTKNVYRVNKSLRDVCVFAQHNILNDPPFSRMDFISCRNLLIYLDNSAQRKAIQTFHYALNDGGYLMLGKSETTGTSTELFTPFNKKYRIYTRKKNTGTYKIPVIPVRNIYKTQSDTQIPQSISIKKSSVSALGNLGNAFDALLLANYIPASVIINHEFEILQFRGPTSTSLQHSPGKASFNILKMADPEIIFELRNAIHHAIKTKKIVRKEGLEMNKDIVGHKQQIVNIEAIPFYPEGEEPLLAIVFTGHQLATGLEESNSRETTSNARQRRIIKLENELALARSDMGSITQDQEAVNEELQSANEEIVSSNEELQSLNEELETSKEEIESTNEELTTSNQELHTRIQQVEELTTYYETILSTVYEPVLILDKNIRVKSANSSFYKMFHLTAEDSTGTSLYKLGKGQWNIPKLRELLEDIVPKNNKFHDFEVEQKFPIIGNKTLLLNAHRIFQPNRNEEYIVLAITDITEVKKMAIALQIKENKILEVQVEVDKKSLKIIEESNKRYNMLLMQSPFAIAILKGKDMIVSLANKSIKDLWGKGNSIEGKKLLQILPELKDGKLPELINKVYTSGIPFHGYEVLVPMKRNGKMKDLYFNFVYQPYLEANESISGVTVISYEVTEHVIAKNELKNAKLIAEKKTILAESAMKSKQQFLSNMSHEIRTPMNAIIGFTNVVLKSKLNESQKEYLNAIKVSGDALIILINDILDLAKVDSGKMTFNLKPFSIDGAVKAMLQLFYTKIKEKKIEIVKIIDPSIPPLLLGDQLRLRQIMINLVSNALKFTNKGTITVNVRLVNENEEHATVEFKITDTGIGIPNDRLSEIFRDFEQASKETTRSYGGTGLGLAIVKQLVELQGGTMMVQSELGKGSTFGFRMNFQKVIVEIEDGNYTGKQNKKSKELYTTNVSDLDMKPIVSVQTKSTLLPKSKQKKGDDEKAVNSSKDTDKVSVLVVEDMALNQLLIKIILLEFGYDIDIASNGKKAITQLEKKNYDIILMDLQMPEMNGFDTTIYIRDILKSTVPIIALTADVTTMDEDKCKAIGMNDYISKPIDEKLLQSKIQNCLKNATR